MRVTLTATYRGPALQGEMDSVAAADAIRGSVDLLNAAARITYGGDAISHGRIKAFKKSSFEIQQVFEVVRDGVGIAASALPLLPPIEDIKPLITLLKAGFDLLKHLRGEKPKKVLYADNGSVSVENNSGVVNVYNQNTVTLVLHTDASRSAQRFVGNPMVGDADEVDVKLGGETVVAAKKEDASCFRDVTSTASDHIGRQEVMLRVISPVLEGAAQWKFNDGGRTFAAKIEDVAFMKRVDDGVEKFRRGDRIHARLRTEQSLGPNKGLKMKYFVEEVLGRDDGMSTPELPLAG